MGTIHPQQLNTLWDKECGVRKAFCAERPIKNMLADSVYSTTRCGAQRMTQRDTRAGIVSGWKLRIISVVMKVV